MGLLMSDTMLIDPMLDGTAWLRDGLGAWVYQVNVASAPCDYEAADASGWVAIAGDASCADGDELG